MGFPRIGRTGLKGVWASSLGVGLLLWAVGCGSGTASPVGVAETAGASTPASPSRPGQAPAETENASRREAPTVADSTNPVGSRPPGDSPTAAGAFTAARSGTSRVSSDAAGSIARADGQSASASTTGESTSETAASRPEATDGPSASWPSFRNGPRQLGIAGTTLPEKLQRLWKVETPDGMVTTPAILDGRVYAGTLSGTLLCLDLDSGETLWKYTSIENPEPDAFMPGFVSSPLVTEALVFVGDEDGQLHAVDRKTGKRRWVFKTGAEIHSSANRIGDRIVFGSHDNNLYCLKIDDGSVVWRFETENFVYCAPAIADGYTFVAGCDEHLRVIDVESGRQRSAMPVGTYLIASPAVPGDTLYVGTYAGEVLAVDWKNEKIVWRYRSEEEPMEYHSSAAVTDRYVVVGSRDRFVHCIDRKTGQGVWRFRTRGKVDSSPIVVGRRVFVGSSDRNIYALHLADGEMLWKENLGRPITGSPAAGEGVLVVGTEGSGGAIFAFGAPSRE